MKTAAIIVAAGSGTRFGGELPKQYCVLGGQAILRHSYAAFANHPDIDDVVIVIAADALPLLQQAFDGVEPAYVFGGATRCQSVQAGLQALQNRAPDYVLIHDGARPFVHAQDISNVLQMTQQGVACAPALPLVDAIKQVDGTTGEILADADRNQFQRVQTPQGFGFLPLVAAYAALDQTADFHDDLAVAAAAGLLCNTIAGNPQNVKITTRHDLEQAELIMNRPAKIYVSGTGFDVHQTCQGDGMTLCGVFIDGELSLRGHSDADVGLHAITDAILGAMALGDIGDHFPPSDPQWENANSSLFLRHAQQLTEQHGGTLVHVDVTLVCEAPKIKPHRQAMRERVANILGVNITQVSVKATTTEQLGFTGRGEGIMAQACVTIEKDRP